MSTTNKSYQLQQTNIPSPYNKNSLYIPRLHNMQNPKDPITKKHDQSPPTKAQKHSTAVVGTYLCNNQIIIQSIHTSPTPNNNAKAVMAMIHTPLAMVFMPHPVIRPIFARDPFTSINQKLETQINTIYAQKACSHQHFLRQFHISEFVESCIKMTNGNYQSISSKLDKTKWSVFKFGSAVWGIDTKQSDMDMAIDMKQSDIPRSTKQQILKGVMQRILAYNKSEFQSDKNELIVHDITSARYPIIKIRDLKYGIKIDLSVADKYCLKTAEYILQMLNFYEKYRVPVRRFIVFIKYWSKRNGINDSMNCYLNSFGFTLMCINFIQCLKRRFLIGSIENVSCLVVGFFAFYGFIFDHRLHRIDFIQKTMLPKKQRECVLEIVDPVNRQNNVAKNVGLKQWMEIKCAMMRACQMYTHCDYDGSEQEGQCQSTVDWEISNKSPTISPISP